MNESISTSRPFENQSANSFHSPTSQQTDSIYYFETIRRRFGTASDVFVGANRRMLSESAAGRTNRVSKYYTNPLLRAKSYPQFFYLTQCFERATNKLT